MNEQHTSVIQNLNSDLFGRFNRLTGYGTLFSDDAFIAYYEHIRIGKNIVFSCVYETGGSMIMRDRDGQTYLFNIYSAHEIRSILFESAEFEGTISDVNKERCLAFSLIVDYKNKREGCLFDTFLSDKLTDAFHTLTVNGESYYITLKKLAG